MRRMIHREKKIDCRLNIVRNINCVCCVCTRGEMDMEKKVCIRAHIFTCMALNSMGFAQNFEDISNDL